MFLLARSSLRASKSEHHHGHVVLRVQCQGGVPQRRGTGLGPLGRPAGHSAVPAAPEETLVSYGGGAIVAHDVPEPIRGDEGAQVLWAKLGDSKGCGLQRVWFATGTLGNILGGRPEGRAARGDPDRVLPRPEEARRGRCRAPKAQGRRSQATLGRTQRSE
ncbi:unnamed protein product, partial [Prorocentrum cordatum]